MKNSSWTKLYIISLSRANKISNSANLILNLSLIIQPSSNTIN